MKPQEGMSFHWTQSQKVKISAKKAFFSPEQQTAILQEKQELVCLLLVTVVLADLFFHNVLLCH